MISNQNFKILALQDTVKIIKIQTTDCENIFAKDTSDKGLLAKIYKEQLKLNTKKMNSILK